MEQRYEVLLVECDMTEEFVQQRSIVAFVTQNGMHKALKKEVLA